jgi:hypothetical protein
MATISIVISDLPDPAPDVSVDFAMSETDAGRMLTYITATYGHDAQGQSLGPIAAVREAADKIVDGIMENTARREREIAAAAAVAAISAPVAALQE